MKKKILSIAVFVVLFFGTFYYLNKAFSSEHHYVNTIEDFKKLSKETNIDLVFYGSSHSYTAYNPAVFNKICNTVSYNLGSDGLRMCFTDLILEESLKFTKPKLIVLEVYDASLTLPKTDKAKGYQLRALDVIPNYSIAKWKKISEVYGEDDYLSIAFPLIRNHDKWNEVNYINVSRRQELDSSKQLFYNGFIGSKKTIKEVGKFKDFKIQRIIKDTTKSQLGRVAKKSIQEFLYKAKANGSKVLVISSPDLRVPFKKNNYFFSELEALLEKNDTPFLNLNDHYQEMDLEVKDFRDPGHLNINGANKASVFLANYIKENELL